MQLLRLTLRLYSKVFRLTLLIGVVCRIEPIGLALALGLAPLVSLHFVLEERLCSVLYLKIKLLLTNLEISKA